MEGDNNLHCAQPQLDRSVDGINRARRRSDCVAGIVSVYSTPSAVGLCPSHTLVDIDACPRQHRICTTQPGCGWLHGLNCANWDLDCFDAYICCIITDSQHVSYCSSVVVMVDRVSI
ncbi:hypothetical protein C8T65DRAFT_6909 [Cerioporus squamosus]|nr:hypothetical protein C8T65DRAFT_6909 [Cerioporus squamosus]